MRATRITWWRIGFSVAMIPLMATLEVVFGRPFWVGVIEGLVVGGGFWLSPLLRLWERPRPQVTTEQQASTREGEGTAGDHG